MATTTTTTTEEVLEGDEKKISHSVERKRIRNEIVETEEKYCEALTLLRGLYVDRLEKERKNASKYDMTDKSFKILIMNLPTLTPTNLQFLEELRETDPLEVATVMNKYADMFKMYCEYTNEFEIAMSTITKLKASNKKFRPVLEDIDRSLQCVGPKLNLMSYLIMPVQRIPRYELLLKSLIKASSKGHPKWGDMNDAHRKFGEIGSFINEKKSKRENMQKMMDICEKITGLPSSLAKTLVVPYRKLVKDGTLTLTMSTGISQKSSMKICQRHVYLFNDMLIICKADGVAFKGFLTLSSASVETKDDGDGGDGGCDDFSVSNTKSAFGFRESDATIRKEWIQSIEDCIVQGKKIRDSKRKLKSSSIRSLTKRDHSVHNLILDGLKDINTGKINSAAIPEKTDS